MSTEIIGRDYYLPSSKGQDYIATVSASKGIYRIIVKKPAEIDPDEGQIKVLRQFDINEAPEALREIQKYRNSIILYNELHFDSTKPNHVVALLITPLNEESASLRGLSKAFEHTIAVYVAPPEENQES